MSLLLISTAKALLDRLNVVETHSAWHANCFQHYFRLFESYSIDTSKNASETYVKVLSAFIGNLKIIVDVVASHEADPSSIGSTIVESLDDVASDGTTAASHEANPSSIDSMIVESRDGTTGSPELIFVSPTETAAADAADEEEDGGILAEYEAMQPGLFGDDKHNDEGDSDNASVGTGSCPIATEESLVTARSATQSMHLRKEKRRRRGCHSSPSRMGKKI